MSSAEFVPTPPEGFYLVEGGNTRDGDMVWDDTCKQWARAAGPQIRDEVEAYYGVARQR